MALLLIVSAGLLWGCATPLSIKQETQSAKEGESLSHIEVYDLAGVWEYEEANVVYPLTFDREGNGIYEWKNGRFTTTSLDNGIWRGTWSQSENDREGRFEIHLAKDLQTAEGRWWYTRIEQDHDPLNPGGTFSLKRLPIDNGEGGERVPVQNRHD